MKKLVFSIIVAACLIAPSQAASAHVLITDETKTSGAVLHIIPDDDPFAGEEATFYLDTQYQLTAPSASVELIVTDASGVEQKVQTELEGTLATADFVFPVQGVYDLKFTVTTEGKTYVFKQSQRVSRGVSNSPLEQPRYAWAEILVIASAIGFALLVIAFITHKKGLAKHSTF